MPGSTSDAPGRAGTWRRDLLLAGAVALVLSVLITLSPTDGDQPLSPGAYVFAIGFGALLLLRRSMPIAMLVLSALGTFAYYTLDFPTIGVALPVVAALYAAAGAGLLRWSIGTGALVFVVALAFRLRDDPQPLGVLLGTDAATNIALIAGAIALGYGVRARRVQAEQQEQIAHLVQEQARRDGELRVRSEREHISRELHDTIGHSLSVISLHAGVGADALGRDDRAVAGALAEIRTQSHDSLTELRSMVRMLRSDAAQDTDVDARRVHSLADIEDLCDRARTAGLDVTAHVDVRSQDLAAVVDTAAYRLVQESLTNVLRHAGARTVTVRVELDADRLRIMVGDDGRGADDADGARTDGETTSGGHGLVGMRERARLLGGTLTTHSTPGKGFRLEATLPRRPAP